MKRIGSICFYLAMLFYEIGRKCEEVSITSNIRCNKRDYRYVGVSTNNMLEVL